MIKGLIVDVDGVLIGERVGFNFPAPHPEVISRLRDIANSGLVVSLCTAKPHFSVRHIIRDAELHNFHITDGGGVIIDPLENKVLEAHVIPTLVAQQIVAACLRRGTYVEAYTTNTYFAQTDQRSAVTTVHADILQVQPTLVPSLVDQTAQVDVTKIMPIVANADDMAGLNQVLAQFTDQVTISWGVHPIALPRRFGIITARGISKQHGAQLIAKHSGLSIDEFLGIGDSSSDWQFIKECGYAGIMGNASLELKANASGKGVRSFVGNTVDNNGVIDILDHFGL